MLQSWLSYHGCHQNAQSGRLSDEKLKLNGQNSIHSIELRMSSPTAGTLTFDLLIPKPHQFIFITRCTIDKSSVKIHQCIPQILQKQHHVQMDRRTDRRHENKMILVSSNGDGGITKFTLVKFTYMMLLLMRYRGLQSVHVARMQGNCPPQTTVPESQAGFVETQSDHVVQHATTIPECPNDLAHWATIHIRHSLIHAWQPASSMSLYHDLRHLLPVLYTYI